MKNSIPPDYLPREDETADALFYQTPRLVEHIDTATIRALTQFYREQLPAGGDLLDLMSSWISHLPAEVAYGRVAGLGMNREELAANPRLADVVVHDLNGDPVLPYADASFDAVLNVVSVQYLTRPVEVFKEIARVLRPGGMHVVAMSHRLFPTKAIAAFRQLAPFQRVELVTAYFAWAGGFAEAQFFDRSPPQADPLWIVVGRRL
jgi:SAM-dependent methyltransferase